MDYQEKPIEMKKKAPKQRPFLKARDTPPIGIALLYGFQQVMVCVSALLTVPLIMADSLCPGSSIGMNLVCWNHKNNIFQLFSARHLSVPRSLAVVSRPSFKRCLEWGVCSFISTVPHSFSDWLCCKELHSPTFHRCRDSWIFRKTRATPLRVTMSQKKCTTGSWPWYKDVWLLPRSSPCLLEPPDLLGCLPSSLDPSPWGFLTVRSLLCCPRSLLWCCFLHSVKSISWSLISASTGSLLSKQSLCSQRFSI